MARVGATIELQPSFRVVEAGPNRVVLRSRISPGSMRCCGPLAVAMAMVAGFALFFIMQGNEAIGGGNRYQCIPLGVGVIALGLTGLNVLELLHREEILFDRILRAIIRRDIVIPVLLRMGRWRIPFGQVQAVRFYELLDQHWPNPIWTVALLLRTDVTVAIDQSTDQTKMFALANYLAEFLEVPLLQK